MAVAPQASPHEARPGGRGRGARPGSIGLWLRRWPVL